jgi:putative hydrolase of the HAD superfamily
MFKAILFDFGGVLAEEGFRDGLKHIAEQKGIDPDVFFSTAEAIIYETGYVTGLTTESVYWDTVRERTGITGKDRDLRGEILKRFVLRPRMIASVDLLRSQSFKVAMLSDQTNWLDEINEKTGLFRHFDRIFNSYHLNKSKREMSIFAYVCRQMDVTPGETVFVDDNKSHIDRAVNAGLKTIYFKKIDDYEKKMHLLTGTTA